jgi:parallel beta-helix repeat protein
MGEHCSEDENRFGQTAKGKKFVSKLLFSNLTLIKLKKARKLRRIVPSVIVILLFLTMFAFALTVQPAKAESGAIHINPDGSISPSTANITTSDNITYTFTDNNYLPMVVNRSNIIINGRGHTLQAVGGTGFSLPAMNNVTIKNTTITNCTYGIYLDSSSGNVLSGNSVTANDAEGIWLNSSSDNNTLFDNNVAANRGVGTSLDSSSGNVLSGNNFTANSCGVDLSSSSDNRIFHNDFLNNTSQAEVSNSTNMWDDGYPSGGNYWSDYNGTDLYCGPYQNLTGSDGIGDTPYVIDANNTDYYPLMSLYVPFENQTIYIRADGTVDPSGSPILREGDLYTLTDNVTCNADGIVIERDNMVLDGASHTLQGGKSAIGVDVTGINNVTIKNTNTMNFEIGIQLENSSNDNTSENDAIGNDFYGIWLNCSSDNVISGNNAIANHGAQDVGDGIGLDFSSNNSISGNNVVANDIGGIGLNSYSNNNSISENNIANNLLGIWLNSSSNENRISGNNITDNNYGIELQGSSNNVVRGNIMTENMWYAFWFSYSYNNTVCENNAVTNPNVCIWLEESSNNKFYHNNFINSSEQVWCTYDSRNIWDDGYPSGGNYWSGFSSADLNHDGIADKSYPIYNTPDVDRYPLMAPFSTFNVGVWNGVTYDVDMICNSSISNLNFNSTAKTLTFDVTGTNGTGGFCRVDIPKKLMWCNTSDQWTVTINGTMSSDFTVTTDANFTYIYFTYHHSTELVQIQSTSTIPEFQPSMLMLLFMITTLLSVMIFDRKRKEKRLRRNV